MRDFLWGVDELWADYAAYDHVALAQLFGMMIGLPDDVPMFTHELQQLWEQAGRPPKPTNMGEHNALEDARYDMKFYMRCQRAIEERKQ